MAADRSKVIKFSDATWKGVDVRTYKPVDDRHRGVTRRTLVGDAPDETAATFVTRVFEIAPEGYSSLERHEHPHTVVVLRGRGTVVLDGEAHAIAPFDCIYVAPRSTHQFQADDEPLAFLCIVDRTRDRPVLPAPDEIRALRSSGAPVKGLGLDET